VAVVILSASAMAETAGPVGLLTEVGQAEIRRAGAQTGIPAYKGDLVFAGDRIHALKDGLTIAFCPTNSSYSVRSGDLEIGQSRMTVGGKTTLPATAQLPACNLPYVQPESRRDLRPSADRAGASISDPVISSSPLTPEQQAAAAAFDSRLRTDPKDILVLLGRAIALEAAGAFNQAAQDYKTFADLAPKADWALDEMHKLLAQRDRIVSGEGKILGLVIGIATYSNLPAEIQLHYPDKDAEEFYRYLVSARGGARPADVLLLENEHAQLGDIRVAIAKTFANAKDTDTVVIFIAGHGTAVTAGPNAGAYILTYNSDPQNLPDSALRMEDLQDLTNGQKGPRQVRLFVDACKAGTIGTIRNNRFNLFEEDFLNRDRPVTEVLGLLASRKREDSYECSNFGHGAFSYFLLRGLNTTGADAVDQRYGQVTVNSLTNYVSRHVSDATKQLQNPQMIGNLADRIQLANKDVSGTTLGVALPAAESCDMLRGIPPTLSAVTKNDMPNVTDPFEQAIGKGLLLPNVPGSSFDMLLKQRGTLDPKLLQDQTGKLLAALENAGQEVILQYLKGEESPPSRADFQRCENLFAAAAQLQQGGDAFVNGRLLFARGRVLIFDKNFPAAIEALKEAIRIDPSGAYAYNALGIAYLESADYSAAIRAFEDAARLAPQWAYARHNLALTLTQQGQYQQALVAYQDAKQLGAQFSYIPFNMGLLYQRLNQAEAARREWRTALNTSPQMTRAWNAIGVSYFLERRFDKSEAAYRTALKMADTATDRLAVRHDLALLLSEEGHGQQALDFWRLNLQEAPKDVPSLIGLGDELSKQGKTDEATNAMATLLEARPDYTGARLKYAKLLIMAGSEPEATTQLETVLAQTKENSEAAELLADVKAKTPGGSATALSFYRQALANARSRDQRERIRRKIRSVSERN
jgi:tetratricopeptide (TPR) repeat protein